MQGPAPHTSQPTLGELLAWAAREAAVLRREVPQSIHARSGDREDWGRADPAASRGLPFSVEFERYIDRDLDGRHAVVRALWQMRAHASPGSGRQMFRVCLALLQGEDAEEIRRRLRLDDFAFATVALNGLCALRIKTEAMERMERQAA